jgi:hypothetical protein
MAGLFWNPRGLGEKEKTGILSVKQLKIIKLDFLGFMKLK